MDREEIVRIFNERGVELTRQILRGWGYGMESGEEAWQRRQELFTLAKLIGLDTYALSNYIEEWRAQSA